MDSLNSLDKKTVGIGAAVGAALTLAAGLVWYKATNHGKRDNGALKEFSVVYTDRALNLMSTPFQQIMREISATLKEAYNADSVAIIPGSGTYGMEACARQFGLNSKVLVVRNGYFSFRWSDIFECCSIPSDEKVMMAYTSEAKDANAPQFQPADVADVVAAIREFQPKAVFAPHVETSTGILLSNEYIKAVADAAHEVGAVFVLDCIASGTVWVDMEALGIDAVISAPQKGWSGPACCAMVMLSKLGRQRVQETKSNGFACNLGKWLDIMDKYVGGGFGYYTTLPTDALRQFHRAMMETKAHGFKQAEEDLRELGTKVRAALAARGFKSVAADGWAAPGVVVVHAESKEMVARFKKQHIQVAGGVPFKLGEAPQTTFRIGLFGLDKIKNISGCVRTLERAVDSMSE